MSNRTEAAENTIILAKKTLFAPGEQFFLNRSNEGTPSPVPTARCNRRMHHHDFIEFTYVLSGRGIHRTTGKSDPVEEGDLIVTDYGVPHAFYPEASGSGDPVVFNCSFIPEFLDDNLVGRNEFNNIFESFIFQSLFAGNNNKWRPDELSKTIFRNSGVLFHKMYQEYKKRENGFETIIRAHLIELIIEVFRRHEASGSDDWRVRNRDRIKHAIEYVRSHFKKPIRLEDVASQSLCSKSHFCRCFKEVTGMNLGSYIQRLRIEKASLLLSETRLPVERIISSVGFNDMKYFYTTFKKIRGVTPGTFRMTVNHTRKPAGQCVGT